MENHDSDENVVHHDEHHTPITPKKQTWWMKLGGGSLMVAALVHAVLFIAGGFWVYQIIVEPEKKVDFMPAGSGGGGERSSQTKVQQKKRQQITPSTNVKRVFAEGATSSYSIPDPGDSFGEMSALASLGGGGMGGGGLGSGVGQGFGKGDGLGGGTGIGNGGGVGKLFGLIPETMRKRCSKEDRLQRLKENGGTPACEEATLKGLRWLKSKQLADGSWPGKPVGYTGLVLLAYFGHCETPASEEFGDSCLKGIVYLIDRGMKNDGRMADTFSDKHWPYEHAIATYALGEALTFCKEMKLVVPNLKEVTEKAGQFIIDNQHKNGGWAYGYDGSEKAHTDTSVSGFQIQALKACSHTSIEFKGMQPTIRKALDYINGNQDESGGYGYTNTKSIEKSGYHTLTGVGMLANQMWGNGNRREVRKGADYILKNSKFTYDDEWADLYGHYYESQAMMQVGGEAWEKYNLIFRDQVLKGQNPDGSWREPGGGKKLRAVGRFDNPIYRTVLCTLMLEVYYRFLSTDSAGRRHSGI